MSEVPEWIRVAQDGNGVNGGFWTCAAATEYSPKFIREDVVNQSIAKAIAQERERCAMVVENAGFGGLAHYEIRLLR